ncbi:GrpB family protein [Paenibacillus sp. WQ 127069]|uniref:GrpB family protein n=1 Tax=Paenibacillus baimaensis TaxID=2982185 RepID=A0ABT2UCX4_9BACL|nr:GrpB family protein [Paenibacillus sp. WQ 127069]MCU6792493.1 GrpB family protein [Paenibacillus sp. WQ 127069]
MGIDEPINVVPYNEQWTVLFENEKSILSIIFKETALEIQHFGSTSVPGMLAKPIIDILIGVRTLELDSSTTVTLEQIGYEGFGESGVKGRLYFRKRKEHAYNLAIVVWNGEQWVNNILIRNYLRKNPDIAKQYSDRKLSSLNKGITTLLAYSDEKADYVYSLLERARQSIQLD